MEGGAKSRRNCRNCSVLGRILLQAIARCLDDIDTTADSYAQCDELINAAWQALSPFCHMVNREAACNDVINLEMKTYWRDAIDRYTKEKSVEEEIAMAVSAREVFATEEIATEEVPQKNVAWTDMLLDNIPWRKKKRD